MFSIHQAWIKMLSTLACNSDVRPCASLSRCFPHPIHSDGHLWWCASLLHGAGAGTVPQNWSHLNMETHLSYFQRWGDNSSLISQRKQMKCNLLHYCHSHLFQELDTQYVSSHCMCPSTTTPSSPGPSSTSTHPSPASCPGPTATTCGTPHTAPTILGRTTSLGPIPPGPRQRNFTRKCM